MVKMLAQELLKFSKNTVLKNIASIMTPRSSIVIASMLEY